MAETISEILRRMGNEPLPPKLLSIFQEHFPEVKEITLREALLKLREIKKKEVKNG